MKSFLLQIQDAISKDVVYSINMFPSLFPALHLHESSFTYQLLPLLSAFPGAKKKNPAFDFFLSVAYIKESYCIYIYERYYYCSCPESVMNVGLLLRKEEKKCNFW